MAKHVLQNTSIAGVATPDSGLTVLTVDSTTKRLATKDDAGSVRNYVVKEVLGGRLYIPFGTYASLGNAISSSPSYPHMCVIGGSWTFATWTQCWYVTTLNNGSNYWTINIRQKDGSLVATTDTILGSIVGAWGQSIVTSFSISSVTGADRVLYTEVIKTGSPGTLNVPPPCIEVVI